MNKRKITYRVLIDGVVTKSNTEMRRVYTDSQGEYIKSMGRKYRLVNDSYDIVYTTGKAFTFAEVFKDFI